MNRITKDSKPGGEGATSMSARATAMEEVPKFLSGLRDPQFLPKYFVFPSLQVLWPVAFLLLTLSLYWGLR